MVLSPPPTPRGNIQAHLYEAFINGETCDVSLICVGAAPSSRANGRSAPGWRASYESHRVILIQAGYFRSLFTAGFAESQTSSASPNAKNGGRSRANSYAELDVRLRFDDPNITRAGMWYQSVVPRSLVSQLD